MQHSFVAPSVSNRAGNTLKEEVIVKKMIEYLGGSHGVGTHLSLVQMLNQTSTKQTLSTAP